ncbi:MAG TPA: DEAD/DEAH box helicase, partial [Lacipirellulaceae bacterium]|nr:DEAD/DEAH box helicase [Lacipirellulaceae bacterium]
MPSAARRIALPSFRRSASATEFQLPHATDWRTTDQDEINRRILRAREEQPRVRNLTPQHRIFSNFEVQSRSGLAYEVEVRNLAPRQFGCTCTDFKVNGLGTCKHVEAVLAMLQARSKKAWTEARQHGSTRIDVVPDPARQALVVERNFAALPRRLRHWFASDGSMPVDALEAFRAALRAFNGSSSAARVSVLVAPWLESLQHAEEKRQLRRDYEQKVQTGEYPAHETLVPLYPYQREGMLHLAFTGRALLADEMGLGKTIQAIAACALLHRLGQAKRVLVVTPASLKAEWEEQIRRFTPLPLQIVFGNKAARLRAYGSAPFFTLVNYEQMLADALDVNARLRPDLVVLDEAQRIKNWASKTAQAVKRLRSRYAFVLTGTPIENRLDELYSIVSFLDPGIFGPLFRFNREFYRFDDRGRPEAYLQLQQVHERIRPIMIRRRKSEVEKELPSRADRNLFIKLAPEQRQDYAAHEQIVA